MAVRYEDGTFQSKVDKLKLFARSWVPEEAKAVVIVVHGYMEHCGRYERFCKELCAHKYACYTLDHRSHGKSQDYRATRALLGNFQDVVDDLSVYVNKILEATAATNVVESDGVPTITPKPFSEVLDCAGSSSKAPGVPVFIFGHSMGGLTTTKYMLDYGKDKPIRAVALSAPFFESLEEPNCFLRGVLRVVGSAFPKLGVKRIGDGLITRDKEENEKYNTDPLNTRTAVPAGTALQFMYVLDEMDRRMGEFSFPYLLIHGTDDKLVNVDGSRKFAKRATSKEQTVKYYDNGYHELLNELPALRQQVTRDVVNWLDSYAKL